MIVVWLGALVFWALRWLMGLTLAAGFLLFTGANAFLAVRRLERNGGLIAIPLIGGVAGALACFVLPYDGLEAWWWAPLIVDVGSAPMLIYVAVLGIVKLADL